MDGKSGQSILKFQRKEQFWTKGGNFKVYIDQKLVGKIGNDSKDEFFVEPGQHMISTKMGWSKSDEIIIQSEAGETNTLFCGYNGPVLNSLFIIVFMQFFITNILKPFHLGIPMEKRIDFYYFVIICIITLLSSLIPSVLVNIKIIEPEE